MQITILLFIFGLGIGSFLNVVLFRYAPEKNVFGSQLGGRSSCLSCSRELRWYELIPVLSFIFQKGRCSTCAYPLSWQYPLVELFSGVFFVLIPYTVSSLYGWRTFFLGGLPWWAYGVALLWVLVFLLLLLITVIDFRYMIIPNELNVLLGILGAGVVLFLELYQTSLSLFYDSFLRHYALLFSFTESIVLNHVAGAFLGGGLFVLLFYLTRGRAMGFGDVKLAFSAGLLFGFPDIIFASLLGFLLGGAWGLLLISLGRKHMKDKVPFAPFFVAGMALTVFFGYDIIHWYFSAFGI